MALSGYHVLRKAGLIGPFIAFTAHFMLPIVYKNAKTTMTRDNVKLCEKIE